MGQHIRRDLTFYDGNSNRQFFARTIDSVGLSVRAIAGQVAALFGIYDTNDDLIAGFESDGDVFAPNFISRYGEAGQFDLNSFYDDHTFGVNSSFSLDEANNQVIVQTENSSGDTLYGAITLTDDPTAPPAASLLTEQKTYTETISALKLLNAVSDTDVQIADTSTFASSKVLGIATQAGVNGDKRSITLFGKVEDLSFNYPVNTLLFLAANGSITDTPPSLPASNFSVNIGYSLGTGAIFLNIQEPIELV